MEKRKVQVQLIICPNCKGKGTKNTFIGDGHIDEHCDFCEGKRVVEETITTEYCSCK